VAPRSEIIVNAIVEDDPYQGFARLNIQKMNIADYRLTGINRLQAKELRGLKIGKNHPPELASRTH